MAQKGILSYRRILPVLILAVLSGLFSFYVIGCGPSQADYVEKRPDIIPLEAMKQFGDLNRPVVLFAHDLHTEAIIADDTGTVCLQCHLDISAESSFKYMRRTDEDAETVMNIYHDNCLACHQEYEEAGRESGPLICGDCHLRETVYELSVSPLALDYSLHQRHVVAAADSCGICHHVLDDEYAEVYGDDRIVEGVSRGVSGPLRSCRDCHLEEAVEGVRSMRQAAHGSCLSDCHLDNEPRLATCGSCHDRTRQASFATMENPPRLWAGQPDFMLVAPGAGERNQAKLGSVPFSHVGHESFTSRCRSCHHVSLQPCHECHTLAGSPAGGGVTLQRAMHDMNSEHSCVGCHEEQKAGADCAGCHGLMEQGRLSDHACQICHAGPPPINLADVGGRYNSLDDFRPARAEMRLSFSEDDIPGMVSIDILEDQYGPALLPHRAIVESLRRDIAANRVATHFHGHEDVVCQGCHHHSPVGQKPPLCESCHGEPFDEGYIHIPGLYGAYHRQCIGCHERMNIEPGRTDCEGCHIKKKPGEKSL